MKVDSLVSSYIWMYSDFSDQYNQICEQLNKFQTRDAAKLLMPTSYTKTNLVY